MLIRTISEQQLVPPKALEPIRRQLSISRRVPDVLMPHPRLDGSGIMAGVGQGIAARVAQHVGMDREGHAGALARSLLR